MPTPHALPASPPRADFTALAWIATHPWLYPALEALHIVGVGLLLGSLVLVELRVWGWGRELPAAALARLGLAVTVAGFGLAALTGLLMFASRPAELLANRVFVLKMSLLMLAGLNAAFFHARGGLGQNDAQIDGLARVQTLVSFGLWVAVIFCGRWVAYV